MTEAKPAHLSGEYGPWFKDPLLAAAYPARLPYPEGVIRLLTELLHDAPRTVLDIGLLGDAINDIIGLRGRKLCGT